ncbi:MAG: hypothetical protein GKR88_06480 [Flavobacteriaceae bacterium]|nr:MAG: hypothetical protein GKR88_06480 [Flavobacteriaceae bacterium]
MWGNSILFFRKIAVEIIVMTLLFLGCSKKSEEISYLFKELSKDQTGIDFKNTLTEDAEHSIINYIYYYNGSGVATGDVNNDGLPDLYFASNTNENKLYLNKGNLTFEDISQQANIQSDASWNTGVTMVDINNDGYLDIYLCSVSGLLDFKGHNELFINNGDGTFTEKAKEYGLDFKGYSTQAYFFDYDKDNDLDVYIVNHAVHTIVSHGPAHQRNKRAPMVGDVLIQNNGGTFTDVSQKAGIFGGVNGYGLSAAIADYNNDGWDDIYVCNDFHEDDYYYINNQDGTFAESLSGAFSTISRFSMGSDVADINGDSYQDLITLDMLPKNERVIKESEGDDAMFNLQERLKKLGYKDQYSRNMLQINNGGAYFHESALFNNIADTDWSWAPLIADFDNDGHQDLFITNGILRRPNDLDFKKYVASTFKNKGTGKEGLKWLYNSINEMPSGKVANQIFKGNSQKFTNKTGSWIQEKPSLTNGAIYADLDLDGDLDLVLNNLNDFAGIYENTSNNAKNYISLKFDYKKGNQEGIGTKAIVYTQTNSQLKQLFKSRGFLSSVGHTLHFGLDTIKNIDSIRIIWPDRTFQKIINPAPNQKLTVKYLPKNQIHSYRKPNTNSSSYFTKVAMMDFVHSEDTYNDFNIERLIPYKVSTLGPAIAIADMDGNGFEDVFIGNASGKKAVLFMNNGHGFTKAAIPEIEKDAVFEDNAAVFFDADNDNDLDVYVASGISALETTKADRLYINNDGVFKKATYQIPSNNLNTSCVAAYDYDHDGDEDLFVGNLSQPNNFGLHVASYLLVNDGKGNFSKDTDFTLISKVTSAIWQDMNEDGYKDLLISTEWDSPKIYMNHKGKLLAAEIPENLNGLWQSVTGYDIDKDGDQDIVLGNWGLNTKFYASANKPLLLYHNDFDSNGKYETVLAYPVHGKYYPVNSKDELASQMNIINVRYIKYKDFALQPVEKVLTKFGVENSGKYEVHTLVSGYIENKNGNFKNFVPLPKDFQLGPVNSFSEVTINGEQQLLVSGNSEKVNTYHGAYTSLKGLLVKTNSDYIPSSTLGIEPFNSQIKKTASISMKDKNILLVLSNNDSLKLYSYKN